MSTLLKIIPTPEPLAAAFDALDIPVTTWSHPAVFRVGENDEFLTEMPGGHTKNLFLKDKKEQLWLITALQDTVIDLKGLPGLIGCGRISFGSTERLFDALGVTPGSVTPLALFNDKDRRVRPVLDARLMACDIVNCHPLINDKTTAIRPQDLVKFLKNMGYDPQIVDFGGIRAI